MRTRSGEFETGETRSATSAVRSTSWVATNVGSTVSLASIVLSGGHGGGSCATAADGNASRARSTAAARVTRRHYRPRRRSGGGAQGNGWLAGCLDAIDRAGEVAGVHEAASRPHGEHRSHVAAQERLDLLARGVHRHDDRPLAEAAEQRHVQRLAD